MQNSEFVYFSSKSGKHMKQMLNPPFSHEHGPFFSKWWPSQENAKKIIFFAEMAYIQNISRGHEILKTFWNFGAPYLTPNNIEQAKNDPLTKFDRPSQPGKSPSFSLSPLNKKCIRDYTEHISKFESELMHFTHIIVQYLTTTWRSPLQLTCSILSSLISGSRPPDVKLLLSKADRRLLSATCH